jgi:uncharacterized protein (TIGR02246 family)
MTADEKEIRLLVETWMSATKRGDLDTVLGLMAEDVVFLVPGQAPMTGKAAYAAATRAQKGVTFDGKSQIQEVVVLGEWAWLRQQLTVVTTPADGGEITVRAGHTLSILRKDQGRWLLARDANLLARVH